MPLSPNALSFCNTWWWQCIPFFSLNFLVFPFFLFFLSHLSHLLVMAPHPKLSSPFLLSSTYNHGTSSPLYFTFFFNFHTYNNDKSPFSSFSLNSFIFHLFHLLHLQRWHYIPSLFFFFHTCNTNIVSLLYSLFFSTLFSFHSFSSLTPAGLGNVFFSSFNCL